MDMNDREMELGRLLVEVVHTFELVVHKEMQTREGELSTYELVVHKEMQVVLHMVVQSEHSLLPVSAATQAQ